MTFYIEIEKNGDSYYFCVRVSSYDKATQVANVLKTKMGADSVIEVYYIEL